MVFRNNVRFPTTLHVHGLLYNKSSEGSPYADGTTGELPLGEIFLGILWIVAPL